MIETFLGLKIKFDVKSTLSVHQFGWSQVDDIQSWQLIEN